MNSILIEEIINSRKDEDVDIYEGEGEWISRSLYLHIHSTFTTILYYIILYYTIELETLNIELDFKSSS